MAAKKHLESLLLEQSTSAPRRALRAARAAGKAQGIGKTQARWVKKKLLRRLFSAKTLGHVVTATAPHLEIPASKTTGYTLRYR